MRLSARTRVVAQVAQGIDVRIAKAFEAHGLTNEAGWADE